MKTLNVCPTYAESMTFRMHVKREGSTALHSEQTAKYYFAALGWKVKVSVQATRSISPHGCNHSKSQQHKTYPTQLVTTITTKNYFLSFLSFKKRSFQIYIHSRTL